MELTHSRKAVRRTDGCQNNEVVHTLHDALVGMLCRCWPNRIEYRGRPFERQRQTTRQLFCLGSSLNQRHRGEGIAIRRRTITNKQNEMSKTTKKETYRCGNIFVHSPGMYMYVCPRSSKWKRLANVRAYKNQQNKKKEKDHRLLKTNVHAVGNWSFAFIFPNSRFYDIEHRAFRRGV